MSLLEGQRVLAIGTMGDRALSRFLGSLGAEIVAGELDDIASADFLVDDLGTTRLAEQGWPRARIEALNPRLIHVSVTPFGSVGARAHWAGSELIASATGGALRLTGSPDRPPVKEALDACTFHADMIAAAGACAAHHARGTSGLGQHVDISIQEATFTRNVNGVLVWQFDRRKLARVGGALNYGRVTVRSIWALADGWCFHALMTGRFGAPANQALSAWIDEAGMPNPMRGTDWLRYDRSALDPAVRATWEAAIDAFFRTRTKADIAGEGRQRGINACVVNEPGDVLADPHLAAREFWIERGGVREPGRFVTVHAAPALSPLPITAPALSDRPGPLAGVKVLDFSWALVGSITTKVLGDLGATVIKVESRTRPCLSRIDVQVSASRPGNFDDKPWFAHLNTSKQSLSLDMKQPEARELLDPLVDWADVVVENFSPGTMAKLGLDYERLSERNPALVMASGSVYGQTGPWAQQWGVDGTGGALSGRTFLTGWADRDPVTPGATPFGDVIVPYVMAASIAAALQRRRETGRGCHLDASMYEISVQQMRSAIRSAQTGERPQRTGNADAAFLLQDVYPARGADRWVAISVADSDQLARLRGIVGGEDIAAWTSARDDAEIVDILQAQGIAAGVVQDMEDLFADPQIAARGGLVELDNPHLGRFGHVRTPIDFSRDRPEPFRAPLMGEHNRAVARLAGLGDRRFAELEAAGVFR